MKTKWPKRLFIMVLAAGVVLVGQGNPCPMPVGGGAQVEVPTGQVPLVALTFDDGPRNSTTGRHFPD